MENELGDYFKKVIEEIEKENSITKTPEAPNIKESNYFFYSMCQHCQINSIIETDSEFFCLNCETSSELSKKIKKINTSSFITNKSIHYKNVIKRLLTSFCDQTIIDELRLEIEKNNIDLEDVDSNFINKKLKTKNLYANKDYKMVFEILSRLNHEFIEEISESDFELISDIFKELAIFIQKEKNQKSINYNFFLDKIFLSVNASKHLQPQMVKNPYKNNINLLTWKNFVYYYNNTVIPDKLKNRNEFFLNTDYVFEDRFNTVLYIK